MTVSYEGDGAHINTEIRSSQGPEPEKLLVIDAKNRVKEMIDKVLEFLLSSQITSALSGTHKYSKTFHTKNKPQKNPMLTCLDVRSWLPHSYAIRVHRDHARGL